MMILPILAVAVPVLVLLTLFGWSCHEEPELLVGAAVIVLALGLFASFCWGMAKLGAANPAPPTAEAQPRQ